MQLDRRLTIRPVPEEPEHTRRQSIYRAARCIGLAALNRGMLPAEIVTAHYKSDRSLDLVMRAASSPHSIANTAALTEISQVFLRLLTPASAGAALLERGEQLVFDGAASISVPTISLSTGAFVGEGAPMPVQQPLTSSPISLTPHKLAFISVLTGEMLRSSNAEEFVRQALVESTGPALDRALFSNNAATADRPAGLLNGIAALTPAAAGEKAQGLVDDLATLATAVAPVAGNTDVVIVAAPAQAVALALRVPTALTWPILTSASLAAGTLIAIAANALVSATDGAPQVDASQQSTPVMADPAAEAVDIGGVIAKPIRSSYQTDSVALRLRWPITWALRDPRGVAWMSGVNW